MIRTSGLGKTYRGHHALTDVSLDVARGECVGLAGPNGSGRSTLLRIVATLERPTSGTLHIDGLDAVRYVFQVRARIGYADGGLVEGRGLSVAQYLAFIASARGRTAAVDATVSQAVARAGLDGRQDGAALSAGMRQRLALASALIHGPDVVILDDPFAALDAAGRGRFTDWICEVRDAGSAVVVASSRDDDFNSICTRIARLDRGRLTGVA